MRDIDDLIKDCYNNDELYLLKKLTLVIPTYNRNFYLSRCLWYHAHFPFGQIIVADSSPEDKKIINRNIVTKIRELFGTEILYLEYKPESEKYGGDIGRKWADAIQHVNTDYSLICTDKEFILPKIIIDAIINLENNNSESIACFGSARLLDLAETPQMQIFKIEPFKKNYSKLETYTEALTTINWNYSQSFSLYPAKLHKELNEPILNKDINDIRYGELYQAFVGLLIDNIYVKNSIGRVRDTCYCTTSNNSPESSTTRFPWINSYAYCCTDEGKILYAGFRKSIAKALVKWADIPNLDAAYQYFDLEIYPKLFRNTKTPYNKIRLFVEKLLIQFDKKSIKLSNPVRHGYHVLVDLINKTSANNTILSESEQIDTRGEIKIILQLIRETTKYHDTDTPIL